MSSFQCSLVARSVRSRITPAWTSSSAWRPWLNCVAPIGSPPVMRLIMTGRATSPDPGIAPSFHLFPVALNALANSATAAASPPDVHQWMTSSSTEAGLAGSAGLAISLPEPALAISPEPALVSPVLSSPPFLGHPGAANTTTTTAANAFIVRRIIRSLQGYERDRPLVSVQILSGHCREAEDLDG